MAVKIDVAEHESEYLEVATAPVEKVFDSKRDREIIEAGGFFCHACLAGKPADDQSPDPRYCQGCYEFLVDEAERLFAGTWRRPKWVPRAPRGAKQHPKANSLPSRQLGCDTIMDEELQGPELCPSVNDTAQEVSVGDTVAPVPFKRGGGPKKQQLPEDTIQQLAFDGFDTRTIADKLEKQGVNVSYRTVARRLVGSRK